MPTGIASQTRIPEEVSRLRPEFLSRSEIFDLFAALQFGWHDDFNGDSIDARWNLGTGGVGSILPTLQANSPSRVLLDTGAVAIGASSFMNEGAFFHYNVSSKLSMLSRARMSSLTNVIYDLLRLYDGTGNNTIILRYNSAVSANFLFRSVSGGVVSQIDSGIPADTSYHMFYMSMQTGSVRARIDNGATMEITTNIPAVDLAVIYSVADQTVLGSKQLEVDLHYICERYNLF